MGKANNNNTGMDLKLKDKVIIVTGGGSGIGKGIVKQLAAEGALPVIISRYKNENLQVVKEVEAVAGRALQYMADLTDPEACRSVTQRVIKATGKIDGLVNNAGTNDGVGLETGSYEDFLTSLHRNVIHYYLMAQYCLPELKKTQGAILNIGSKVSETGQGGTSAYAASNGARTALTREWALELSVYNIRVNALIVAECWTPQYEKWIGTQPSAIKKIRAIQKMIPLGKRMTHVEEVASTAVFLLSECSSHTTGQLIHVDGGYVHLNRDIPARE